MEGRYAGDFKAIFVHRSLDSSGKPAVIVLAGSFDAKEGGPDINGAWSAGTPAARKNTRPT